MTLSTPGIFEDLKGEDLDEIVNGQSTIIKKLTEKKGDRASCLIYC